MPTSAQVSKEALLERAGQEVVNAKSAIEKLKNDYIVDVERATLHFQSCLKRYAELKEASADRCPRQLGTFVKAPEVQFHHEVYNQFLWNLF